MANKKSGKPNPKPMSPQPKVEREEPEIVNGVVDEVDNLLNVRSTPRLEEGNIMMQIKKGTKIQVVDPKKAKGEWYRIVVTDRKTEGYAMKKYIKII